MTARGSEKYLFRGSFCVLVCGGGGGRSHQRELTL